MGQGHTEREGGVGRGGDGSFYESGSETENYASVMRQRNICVRGNVFLRRDGGRENSGCMFSSFFCLCKFSPPYTFPSDFLESELNWVWISVWGNSCIYLSVHSPSCY